MPKIEPLWPVCDQQRYRSGRNIVWVTRILKYNGGKLRNRNTKKKKNLEFAILQKLAFYLPVFFA
jgi:hypothetical protein